MFEVLDLFHCLRGSFNHLPSPTIDDHAKQKQSMFHQQWFKTLFSYYFLFVSCRLFLKNGVRRSANYHLFTFISHACFSFSRPVQPNIHLSLSPSPPNHCYVMWARRGGGRRRRRGRWPTFYLSDFLFVCFISGLVESGQSEPSFLRWAVNVWKAVWLMTCHQPGEKACY